MEISYSVLCSLLAYRSRFLSHGNQDEAELISKYLHLLVLCHDLKAYVRTWKLRSSLILLNWNAKLSITSSLHWAGYNFVHPVKLHEPWRVGEDSCRWGQQNWGGTLPFNGSLCLSQLRNHIIPLPSTFLTDSVSFCSIHWVPVIKHTTLRRYCIHCPAL